ncbi:hypothetical protein HYP67_gp142 [Acinetobacter phage vB_ApiM_fHyAci03]|uniref:Uncharacterized protein n=1 Tax=Acinetobacter phage vB_ApiM_fHyAci03 TaxID=2269366 RepID=A0A345AUX8_9CAUD|nr:hypothetical protein HYP67_gp142 [Acinetobacter phage vB_ApiM_fHyAci03]AXF40711.1 hypothetical protein Ac3_142 [Acinetobacter phage vB_ApiM_fHyAci03]
MAKITQEFAPSDSYTISELYNKHSGKSLIEFTAILEDDSEVPIKIIDKNLFDPAFVNAVTDEAIYRWNMKSVKMSFDIDFEIPEPQIDKVFECETLMSRKALNLPDGQYLAKVLNTRDMKVQYGILNLHKNVSSFQGMFFFDICHYRVLSVKSITLE